MRKIKNVDAYNFRLQPSFTKVSKHVLFGSASNNTPVCVLNVSTVKNEFLVYIDKKSRQTLKADFVADNGFSFVKEIL